MHALSLAGRACSVELGPQKLPTFDQVYTSFLLALPSGSRSCGQTVAEGTAWSQISPKLDEDSSPSLDWVTPAPLRLHPQDGRASGRQTPSQSSSLLSSQQGWGAPKLKAPLSLPQLHPAPEAAGAGLACPSSARPGVGGQEQQLGLGTHTALSEAGKPGESQRKSPSPPTLDYALLSAPPGQC